MSGEQSSLFPHPPYAPEGFAYRAEVISEDLENALVAQFAQLPFAPFQFHQYQGNRRIVSYGFKYDFSGQKLDAASAMPDFLLGLRMVAGALAARAPEDFVQGMVTEYAPGAGIGWHRDKAVFGDVVGLSFLAPCLLRFRRKQGEKWERHNARVAPRSAYLLRGPARHDWHHSIAPMQQMRYSVTFRTLAV
jgi:alkylated DNA repair dioxygenase AlkB